MSASSTSKWSDKTITTRLAWELREFQDPAYTEFARVTVVSEDTVEVVDSNGVDWRVRRGPDFFEPPTVWRRGHLVDLCRREYLCSILAAKWLLGLMVDDLEPSKFR